MILKIFLFLFLPLYLIFTKLALNYKSLKIYRTGVITSLLYFTAVTEGIVYAYKNKIPSFAKPFVKNPFAAGKYKLLTSNLNFNKYYFIDAAVLIIVGWVIIKKKK